MTLIYATCVDTVDVMWAAPEEAESAPLRPSAIASDAPFTSPAGFPESVPRDQLYYWTAKWQSDQNESIRELETGNSRLFTSAADAIEWLVEPTDD